jgi:hypothetical protein
MICEICGAGPRDGVTVYRQNPKGEKGRWRCILHNQARISSDVLDIVEIIEDDNEAKTGEHDA